MAAISQSQYRFGTNELIKKMENLKNSVDIMINWFPKNNPVRSKQEDETLSNLVQCIDRNLRAMLTDLNTSCSVATQYKWPLDLKVLKELKVRLETVDDLFFREAAEAEKAIADKANQFYLALHGVVQPRAEIRARREEIMERAFLYYTAKSDEKESTQK